MSLARPARSAPLAPKPCRQTTTGREPSSPADSSEQARPGPGWERRSTASSSIRAGACGPGPSRQDRIGRSAARGQPTTTTQAALPNATREAPGDDLPRLAYADWLEERGL